jgi:hypothetical protein
MRKLAGLALLVFLLAGAAATGGSAKKKPLRFTVEVSGSQTVTWALDEKVPHAGAMCLGRGGVELGAQRWMVPVRGSGRLTYTFAGREENVQGDSVDLKAPTHGTIHGTDGIYWKSEGYWDPYNICDWDPPIGEDDIASTRGCGAFTATGSFDVAWRAGKLSLDVGWKRLYEGDCPLDTDWRLKRGILDESSVPLRAEELRSGDTISRTKTTTASVSAPTSGGVYSGEAVNTWTVRLIPTGKLRAVPKAAPVYRGGRVTLDGSKSRGEIRSYRWKLARASGCPSDVKLSSETLTGAKVSFTALCPLKATLTVSDGKDTDSATTTVAVYPRSWKTPVSSAPDAVLDSRLVDGFLQLGRNVCAYDGLTGDQTSGHILHRGAGGAKGGFTVAEVKSGPFEGNFYVAKYTAKIRRAALVSKDFAPTTDLYAANSDAGLVGDFSALHASVVDHEHLHTTLIAEYVRKSDRAKRIEAMVEGDEDALSDRVNVALVEFETDLTEATSDAKVKARMAATWNRSATVKLRDGGGGFVSRTFPSLAQLGDEGVG